jgi:hypothetical protein
MWSPAMPPTARNAAHRPPCRPPLIIEIDAGIAGGDWALRAGTPARPYAPGWHWISVLRS